VTRRHRISRALVRLAAKINDQPNVRFTVSYDQPLTWPTGIERLQRERATRGKPPPDRRGIHFGPGPAPCHPGCDVREHATMSTWHRR
jgi:hypothetical protein